LRLATKYCALENSIVLANREIARQRDVVLYDGVAPDRHARSDDGKVTDANPRTQLGAGINNSGFSNGDAHILN
jgi:hypothetical protein